MSFPVKVLITIWGAEKEPTYHGIWWRGRNWSRTICGILLHPEQPIFVDRMTHENITCPTCLRTYGRVRGWGGMKEE